MAWEVKARSEIGVSVDRRGRSIATVLRCEAPLLVRIADRPGDGLSLLLVGGAAGPLGGDDLQLRLHVGPGALVEVRAVGATMVQPGSDGRRSTTDVHVTVESGASVDWEPKPMVSVVGSDHRTMTTIELAEDARLRWTDEVSLGRFGEASGRLALRTRLEIAGRPVLDQETTFGTDPLAGPGAHGSGRCVLSALVVGDDAPTRSAAIVTPELVRGVFAIGHRVALVTCAAATRNHSLWPASVHDARANLV